MDVKLMESEPPPVSIEDRTVVGIVDRGLNSTNDLHLLVDTHRYLGRNMHTRVSYNS